MLIIFFKDQAIKNEMSVLKQENCTALIFQILLLLNSFLKPFVLFAIDYDIKMDNTLSVILSNLSHKSSMVNDWPLPTKRCHSIQMSVRLTPMEGTPRCWLAFLLACWLPVCHGVFQGSCYLQYLYLSPF